MFLGEIQISKLKTECEWFQLGYDLFSFDDAESFRKLKAASKEGLEVLSFIGTWCGDTHDQLPGLVRIFDSIGLSREQHRIFGLDRSKTFPENAEWFSRWGVRRLPTFIFLKRGTEIGRIIETPETTLLRDLSEILSRS